MSLNLDFWELTGTSVSLLDKLSGDFGATSNHFFRITTKKYLSNKISTLRVGLNYYLMRRVMETIGQCQVLFSNDTTGDSL